MAVSRVLSAQFRGCRGGADERILNDESISALSSELKIKRSVLFAGVIGIATKGRSEPAGVNCNVV